MPDFSSITAASLIGNLIFSSIGFVVFGYGKKNTNVDMMLIGGALMLYPYMVSSTALLYLIGAGLTAAAWFSAK